MKEFKSKFIKYKTKIKSGFILCVLLYFILCYLGILGQKVSQLKVSEINKDHFKGFLYSMKFLFISENNKANWIAIGALGVLISYWITIKENSKKIDADLKAKARIDWIQKVRESTSNLISSYNKTIYEQSEENYLENLSEIWKNSEILKLYFGSIVINESEKNFETIRNELQDKNKIDNAGKNDNIVSLIDYVLNKYGKENNYTISKRNDFLEKKVDFSKVILDIAHIEYNDLENAKLILNEDNIEFKEDENKFIHKIILSRDDLEIKIASNEEEITKLKKISNYKSNFDEIKKLNGEVIDLTKSLENARSEEYLSDVFEDYRLYSDLYKESDEFIRSLEEDLKLINEVIRVYLKIEWDIAKRGK